MSEIMKAMIGIVVHKDGTVPFDADCHPDVRARVIAYLADKGHIIEPVAGTPHVKISGWTAGKAI